MHHDGSSVRLGMILLAVDDVAASAAFYEYAFGWRRKVDVPVMVELDMGDGGSLALYRRDSFAANTGRRPVAAKVGTTSGTELYFLCDDLDGAIVRLRAAGARPLADKASKPWGDEAAYFSDPDGNVVVVACPAETEQPPAGSPSIVLELEALVEAPCDDVFEAWSTTAGVMTFFAPEARVEATPGGAYELYFIGDAPPGSRGSEGCTVIEVVDGRHLAFTWSFPPSLPSIREERTRVDLDLDAPTPGTTRVRLRQTGWQTGGDWAEGLEYFDEAWSLVLTRLQQRFRTGPLDWTELGLR